MTNSDYFLPMTHKLFILAYDGCQLLDVTGPAAVFGAANDVVGKPAYDLQIVSADGGLVTSNCGVALQSKKIGGQPDTLLVAGGSRGLKAAMIAPGRAPLAAEGGAAHAPLRLGLHRRLRARLGGPARRQAGGDALGELRPARRTISRRLGRCRGALCRRRQGLDLGRASPPASTWRWRWSRPISARRPPT